MISKLKSLNSSPYTNFDSTGFKPFFGDIWQSDSPVFDILIEIIKPSLIIEVGSWLGSSAIHMAQGIKKNKLDAVIICVDTWLGSIEHWLNPRWRPWLKMKNGYPQIYFQFLFNVNSKGVQNQIIPFPNTSTIAASLFLKYGVKADLIYIDASHEEKDVLKDLESYYPLLSNKGIMFGDDYSLMGVRPALESFSKRNNINHKVLKDENFWIIDRCNPVRPFLRLL